MNRGTRKRIIFTVIGVAALALGLMLPGAATAAKKKKKKSKAGGTVDITQTVGAPIPDGTATTNGMLASTITVADKKFAGTRIRDVNVTLTTLGVTGTSPADNLTARVTAPNGATTWLFPAVLSGVSVGPLTLDDESPNRIFGGLVPAPNATSLVAPYIGTAQPDCAFSRGGCIFSAMDDGPVSGTWTLRIYDLTGAGGETSQLASWRLNAIAGKPFKTK